jgi:hypothetical protein
MTKTVLLTFELPAKLIADTTSERPIQTTVLTPRVPKPTVPMLELHAQRQNIQSLNLIVLLVLRGHSL